MKIKNLKLIMMIVFALSFIFFSALPVFAVAVVGDLFNYPNPFNSSTHASTEIGYQLDQNADIDIYLFSASGEFLWRKHCVSGSSGGSGGPNTYNKVAWNGQDFSGNVVGNGMYVYFLVNNGTVLKKGRMVVFK